MKNLVGIIVTLFLITGFIAAQDTLYFYKAGMVVIKRAVNDIDSLTFTYTPPASGTVTDIDGNQYHWITIGTQKWFVENLKVSKFRTGESISNVEDGTLWSNAKFSAWCYYNNDISNNTKYGKLYNKYALTDSRGLAPVGCHIPTDDEWTILENFLIANVGNYDGSITGNKFAKSISSQTDWYSSSVIGSIGYEPAKNNKFGFTALPGGYRYLNGIFYNINSAGYWWTSTQYDATRNWDRRLHNDEAYLYRGIFTNNDGVSVRCIKD